MSSEEAYNTHKWTSQRQYIPGEPDEWIMSCVDCGIEDRGDPREFEDLIYPSCNEMGELY